MDLPQMVKDPMRDSLLSSDYDPDTDKHSTPSSSPEGGEETWEGVGGDMSVGDFSKPQRRTPKSRVEMLETELEFDYWQGQFEFCLPGLQDVPFVPSGLGPVHDEFDNPSGVRELLNTVKILQGKVEELGDSHNDSQDRIVRVKQDNSVLQARVNMLEEQLRESEHRGEERLAEEMRRNKELITRIERERELTIENYSIKQISLDKTNEMLQEEIQRLKIKMEKQLKESNERENRISEGELVIRTIKEEKKNIQLEAKRELAEKMQMADREILELRSKVEHLTSELQSHSRRRLPSTDADATNAAHMSEALKNLREENGGLREQVEDLQAELLTRSVVEGERVTAAHSNSLKAEFEQMSVEEADKEKRHTYEELQKSLQSAQDDNKHLRSYIDGILLNIIEKYPQLLEVKQKA